MKREIIMIKGKINISKNAKRLIIALIVAIVGVVLYRFLNRGMVFMTISSDKAYYHQGEKAAIKFKAKSWSFFSVKKDNVNTCDSSPRPYIYSKDLFYGSSDDLSIQYRS